MAVSYKKLCHILVDRNMKEFQVKQSVTFWKIKRFLYIIYLHNELPIWITTLSCRGQIFLKADTEMIEVL